MPITPEFLQFLQFACVFQSATGIIVFSEVVIATPAAAEKLMDYVEGLLVAVSQTQIQFHLSIFATPPDLHPGCCFLPAGARQPDKRGLFRWRLFLVHRSNLRRSTGRHIGRVGLHAGGGDYSGHVRSRENQL
jgi:hypothetical protein